MDIEKIINRVPVFINRRLRKLLNIQWPERISNDELWKRTRLEPVSAQLKRRKWKWLLVVHFSSDLSLDKHVSSVSAICFYHLRQLRPIRRSLHADSASTFVHAFVTSRVDYCNAILAGTPKPTTDRLQRVLNAAARVVNDTKKFDQGLSRLMHQELHWLDISERVKYQLGMLTHRCLLGKAPV